MEIKTNEQWIKDLTKEDLVTHLTKALNIIDQLQSITTHMVVDFRDELLEAQIIHNESPEKVEEHMDELIVEAKASITVDPFTD